MQNYVTITRKQVRQQSPKAIHRRHMYNTTILLLWYVTYTLGYIECSHFLFLRDNNTNIPHRLLFTLLRTEKDEKEYNKKERER